MKWKPRFERDGGLGGTVNGHKLFIFADTQTYGTDGKTIMILDITLFD